MMRTIVYHHRKCTDFTANGEQGRKLRAWTVIGAFLGALILFIYVIGPAGLETETLRPMADFIEANDINANAYYYTDVDEFFTAERHMREYLQLVPGSQR